MAKMHEMVVKKFNPDGSSKQYLGHSVICQLPPDSHLTRVLRDLRSELSQHHLSSLFAGEALLPDDSYHCTIRVGIRDQQRGENVMPGDGYAEELKDRRGLNGPYEDWLDWSVSTLRGTQLDGSTAPPYTMVLSQGPPICDYSIGLVLEPTPDTAEKIQNFRQLLGQKWGLPVPKNTVYHITLAYLLRAPTKDESNELKALVQARLADVERVIEFSTVDLCSFEDMQGFVPKHCF
jgi:hypothetical protein